jgi:hypothetical protein
VSAARRIAYSVALALVADIVWFAIEFVLRLVQRCGRWSLERLVSGLARADDCSCRF